MKQQNKQTRPRTGKKRRSTLPVKRKHVAPRTAEEFFAKSEAFQDKLTGVANLVSKMRAEDVSLAQALRESKSKLTRHTALKWGRAALRKGPNGRYVAKASDRLLRVLVVLTAEGKREIGVRDSRQASRIAEHWNAVDRYLSTGDASAVRRLKGKSVTDADGTKHLLLTDLAELDRLGNAGVLSFESIYARTA